MFVNIGESVVEYHNDFKLFAVTKYQNPNFLPEVFSKVTVVNFILTKEGLQNQLLDIIIAKEK